MYYVNNGVICNHKTGYPGQEKFNNINGGLGWMPCYDISGTRQHSSVEYIEVERLDDGFVFEVGHTVIINEGPIKRLRLVAGLYQYSCQDENGWRNLDDIPLVDKSLTITEDLNQKVKSLQEEVADLRVRVDEFIKREKSLILLL